MSKIKKLVLSLSVVVTMAIAFVVGLVGLNGKNPSPNNPTPSAPSQSVKPNIIKPTTHTYKPGEVEIVKCARGDEISYYYSPDVNGTEAEPKVKAYEYIFVAEMADTMAVGIKQIPEIENITISYKYSFEPLDLDETIVTSSYYETQAMGNQGTKMYVYIFVTTTEEVSVPVNFSTSIVWYYGIAGTYSYTANGVTVSKTIVKGQPVEEPVTPEPPSGKEFMGWYLDEECTIPAVFPIASQGTQLYAKFEQSNILPADWIAWNSATNSYKMIDPYGHFFNEADWYGGQATPGNYTRLPEDLIIPEKYDDGVHGEAYITGLPGSWYSDAWGFETVFSGVASHVKSITILAPLTSIPAETFALASSLTSIILPSTITSIGDNAFNYCQKLKYVNFEDLTNLTTIGYNAFYDCYSLSSANFASVTSIEGYAFYDCYRLTSVVLPSNLSSVGDSAFQSCYSLAEVYDLAGLGVTVGSTGYGYVGYYAAVVYDTMQESALVEIDNIIYYPESVNSYIAIGMVDKEATSITLHSNTTKIRNYAFYPIEYYNNPSKVESIDFSSCTNLTTIGAYAFNYCKQIVSITLPNSVTTLGAFVFSDCSSLVSINLPNGITNIPSSAFSSCYALANITLPSGLKTIETYAFSSCRMLTSITLPSGLTSIGNYAFQSCYNILEVYNLSSSITLTKGATTNGYVAYYAKTIHTSASSASNYTVIDNVKYYVENASSYIVTGLADSSLTSITLHANTTRINECAFYGCESLVSVDTSACSNISSIGAYAFYNCHSLQGFEMPSGLTTINAYTFYNCYSLTSITIPSGVTSFTGYYAFQNCYALAEVYDLSTKLNFTIGSTGYGYTAYYAKVVHTSASTASRIQTINGVKYYVYGTDFIALCPATIRASVTSINLDSRTTEIKTYAFYNTNITSVNLRGYTNLTTIGSYAFGSIKTLTSVDLTGCVNLTKTNYAFNNCGGLTNVTLPESITTISGYMFYGCKSLTSIIIPNSVTKIGYYAFYGSGLTSISLRGMWYYTSNSSYTGGTKVDKTNMKEVIELLATKGYYYWYRVKPTLTLNTNNGTFEGVSGMDDYTFEDVISGETTGGVQITNFEYGFALDEDGYYVSQNQGIGDSYAMVKITFTANAGDTITFEAICDGEGGYDFGLFGNLDDTALPEGVDDYDSTGYYYSFGDTYEYSATITYNIDTTGEHFIYIKYRKDGSVNNGDDCLKFKCSIIEFEKDYTSATIELTEEMVTELPTPVRDGYTFAGWYTAVDGGTQVNIGYATEEDLTLYAKWTKN